MLILEIRFLSIFEGFILVGDYDFVVILVCRRRYIYSIIWGVGCSIREGRFVFIRKGGFLNECD